jgi:hypothetical protein
MKARLLAFLQRLEVSVSPARMPPRLTFVQSKQDDGGRETPHWVSRLQFQVNDSGRMYLLFLEDDEFETPGYVAHTRDRCAAAPAILQRTADKRLV